MFAVAIKFGSRFSVLEMVGGSRQTAEMCTRDLLVVQS